ncbi:hypothetical protein [Pseudactinotalea sp.]|uniref:hypothetical protein n=1 Tax=Pseudactinotalea sp. TaxID=1926260 RepID=UPI003B3B529E
MRRTASGTPHRHGVWRYAAAAVAMSAALASPPAAASPGVVEEVVTGEHLQLTSVTNSEMASMSPGRTATWDVGLVVLTPGAARVDVTLEVLSAPAATFEMDVLRCADRWTEGGCPSGADTLSSAPVSASTSTVIDTTDGSSAPWYRVVVTMIADSGAATAVLRLLADGAGEELSAGGEAPPPPGRLPGTGASLLGHLALALAAVLAGVVAGTLARRRTPAGRSAERST